MEGGPLEPAVWYGEETVELCRLSLVSGTFYSVFVVDFLAFFLISLHAYVTQIDSCVWMTGSLARIDQSVDHEGRLSKGRESERTGRKLFFSLVFFFLSQSS